jgi:hypothetical protein
LPFGNQENSKQYRGYAVPEGSTQDEDNYKRRGQGHQGVNQTAGGATSESIVFRYHMPRRER